MGRFVVAGALFGCGGASPQVTPESFALLHRPLYEAAAFSDDPEVLWPHLAGSLHGRLLTRHYVAGISAARQRARDAVTIEVLRVDHDEIEVLAPHDDVSRVRASWSVGARIVHRGHAHLVVQRYAATFEIRQVQAGDRLTAIDVREARRVGARAEASAFDLLDDRRGGYLDALDLGVPAGRDPDEDSPPPRGLAPVVGPEP